MAEPVRPHANPEPSAGPAIETYAGGLTYDVFVSYSSANHEVAKKIEDDLERFPLPAAMQRRIKRRHFNVFLDKSDLVGNQLNEALGKYLESSRTLVVLCSPEARASKHVNDEIKHFAATKAKRQIVPVLIGGGPNTDSRVNESHWAFPDALLEVLENDPVGPDLRTAWRFKRRRDKLARGSAWVQFVAQVLDVDIDEFTDRVAKRELRRRISLWSLVALIATVLLAAALITTHQRNIARHQTDLAISLNRQSTISRLVSDGVNMLNRLKPGDDARALQQLLVANELSNDEQLDHLFAPVMQRRQTSKIIPTRAAAASVALSPDGRMVAAGGNDGAVELFSTDVGAVGQTLDRPAGHSAFEGVTALTFDAGGTQLLAATADGIVDTWDVSTRTWKGSIPKPPGDIRATTISPDGVRVAYGEADGSLYIRDSTSDSSGESRLTLAGPPSALAFSPDGRLLVVGFANGFVQLHRLDGSTVGDVTRRIEPLKTVWSVAVSNDGRIAAGGWGDGASTLGVLLPNAAGDPTLVTCDAARECHQPGVWSVAFDADGDQLVSSGIDNTVRAWDVSAEGIMLRGSPLGGHTDDATDVAFSDDSATIASASTDGTLRLWATPAKGPTDPLLRGYGDHPAEGATVALSPDGRRLATGSADGTFQVWSTADGSPLTGPRRVAERGLTAVAFGENANVATVTEDGVVHVWSAASGYGDSTFDTRVNGARSVAFSSDGRLLAVGGVGIVEIRDLRANSSPCQVPTVTGGVSAVAFADKNPSRVAYGTDTGMLAVVDCRTGSVAMSAEADTGDGKKVVSSVAFSPEDDRYVATAAMGDDVVRVWDVASHTMIRALDGHEGDVTRIAFSSDGRYLVSGAYDDTVRTWNVHSGDPVGPPIFAFDDVTAVRFSPDNRRVVAAKTTRPTTAGSAAGRVMTWPGPAAWKSLLCSKLTYNMSEDQWTDWVGLPPAEYVEACPGLPRDPR